ADDRRQRQPNHALAHRPAPGRPDHRLRDADDGDVHPPRGEPFLPRARHQPHYADVGQPAVDGAAVLPDAALADALAGPGDPAHDPRLQPARRWYAGRVRPEVSSVRGRFRRTSRVKTAARAKPARPLGGAAKSAPSDPKSAQAALLRKSLPLAL